LPLPLRVLGYTGTRVHGYTGIRVHGYTGTRVHGYTGTRVYGYTGTRVHGCTGTRVYGYTGTRVHGYTGTRVHGYTGRALGYTGAHPSPPARPCLFFSTLTLRAMSYGHRAAFAPHTRCTRAPFALDPRLLPGAQHLRARFRPAAALHVPPRGIAPPPRFGPWTPGSALMSGKAGFWRRSPKSG